MGNRLKLIYIGYKPRSILSGGDKYLYEVLDYLEKASDFKYMDFSDTDWFEKGAIFNVSINAIICTLKANLWAIKEFITNNPFGKDKSIIFINSYYKQFFFIFVWFIKMFKNCTYMANINALYFRSRKNNILNMFDKMIMKMFLLPASGIVVNSKAVYEEVVNLGINKVPIKIIYPRLDLPPDIVDRKIIKDDHKLNILFVGHCVPFKELHILIEAIGLLKEYPIILNIVGDPEMNSEYFTLLNNIITRYDISEKIVFQGRKEGKDLTYYYKISDMLVSPGSGEGYGRVLIEAMHFGLPVIGANSGASKELIIPEINGLLFSAKEPNDLAKKIKMMFNREYRDQLADGAKKESLKANFTNDLGAQFFDFIKKL